MNDSLRFIRSKKMTHGFITLLLSLTFFVSSVKAQSPPTTIAGQLPQITPPSPTVSAFMKFEEVPVNNYTGIPDISVPLYSLESLSKDIKMDISLKYHPSSIAIDETASYTGLGWNLFAGGTISRTVKGSPDEVFTNEANQRVGILQDNINDPAGGIYYINRYYQVLSLQGTGTNEDLIGEYGWNVAEKGRFDTEHDLFQYNFMGHTGRFFIKRDQATGELLPIKLDNDNTVKIKLLYNQSDYDFYEHRYIIKFYGFELYDDKGYRYVFGSYSDNGEAVEITEMTDSNGSLGFGTFGGVNLSPSQMQYSSAFHLTKIYDANDQLLVKITYTSALETTSEKTELYNRITAPQYFQQTVNMQSTYIKGMPPKQITSTVTTATQTKKIASIEVVNKGRIFFDVITGREDTDLNNDAPLLNSIVVENWFGQKIKDYNFTYNYGSINASGAFNSQSLYRLMLESIVDKNVTGNNESLKYYFSYKEPQISFMGSIMKDYWGYFNRRKGGMREPDDYWCTAQVLQKMTLPTGGSVVFDFGPNTYSYIGSEEVTDFSIDNQLFEFPIQVPVDGEIGIYPSPGPIESDVFFMPESPVEGGQFYLYSDADRTLFPIDALGDRGMNDGTGASDVFTLLPNIKYYLTFKIPSGSTNTTSGKVNVYEKQRTAINQNPDDKWLMGGGVRINKISYYTDDNFAPEGPIKVKNYNYNFFNDTSKSSGSLAFSKPLFDYEHSKTVLYPGPDGTTTNANPVMPVYFKATANHNNLLYIRTKGTDVGYKNVTVWETGNGKSEYTYTTPIDHPQENYSVVIPPFISGFNLDYKRGLLLTEKHYSQHFIGGDTIFKPVSEVIYNYDRENAETFQTVGHKMYPGTSFYAPEHQNFGSFRACTKSDTGWCEYRGDEYWQYLSLGQELREYYGWPVLTAKTSKDHFYPEGGSIARTVTSTEAYGYNPVNKKIDWTTTTNSLGEILKTTYIYDNNDAGRNRIGVLKGTETWRDSKLLDQKDITFCSNCWGTENISFLPKTISIGKGDGNIAILEPRLQFLKYDIYSNPLEAKQEAGNTVCYIWGYNYSLPIAVIENMDYATLTANPTLQNYINAAVLESNKYVSNVLTYNNTNVLIHLESLRAALPNTASMTIYAHKPLVGVTIMIDSRGYKTTYSYDGFGRLEEVRDEGGNLVSKNNYNYKLSTN